VDSKLGRLERGLSVVALVGPPGAGKTLTLVKLAIRHGIAARRPTFVLASPDDRIAAGETLRCYCALLDLPYAAVASAADLPAAYRNCRGDALVLIDTPGFDRPDKAPARELAEVLSRDPLLDTHLVLPQRKNGCWMPSWGPGAGGRLKLSGEYRDDLRKSAGSGIPGGEHGPGQ
jgi:flagellar biosynthesis GTPase FlhF